MCRAIVLPAVALLVCAVLTGAVVAGEPDSRVAERDRRTAWVRNRIATSGECGLSFSGVSEVLRELEARYRFPLSCSDAALLEEELAALGRALARGRCLQDVAFLRTDVAAAAAVREYRAFVARFFVEANASPRHRIHALQRAVVPLGPSGVWLEGLMLAAQHSLVPRPGDVSPGEVARCNGDTLANPEWFKPSLVLASCATDHYQYNRMLDTAVWALRGLVPSGELEHLYVAREDRLTLIQPGVLACVVSPIAEGIQEYVLAVLDSTGSAPAAADAILAHLATVAPLPTPAGYGCERLQGALWWLTTWPGIDVVDYVASSHEVAWRLVGRGVEGAVQCTVTLASRELTVQMEMPGVDAR